MSSTGIYFVRHGETAANRSFRFSGAIDLPLNKRGSIQASNCYPTISQLDFSAIYCSPLQRARQTASIATGGRLNRPPIIIDNRLVERSFGTIDGKFAPFAMRKVWDYDSSFIKSHYGEETLLTLELRVEDFLNMVRQQHSDQNILVFSHGGVATTINAILNENHVRSGYFFKHFHMKNGDIAYFAL
ncbi:MAG: histidine phosphatase family protein [Candidatus Saccharibacteria bacterium]|nr:histidine phosphatase family protein [Candidatus Saccharibacteria bacterium]